MDTIQDEQWRDIAGFEGFYQVSSFGHVRGLPRPMATRWGGHREIPGRFLDLDDSTGYSRVNLCKNGKQSKALVHRLVAKAFLGGVARQHVNHIDGNKKNNHLSNLEWATPRENVEHAWRMGLSKPHQGESHGVEVLTERDIRVIRDAASRSVMQRQIAQVFNVTEAQISSIVRMKSWTHLRPERSAS